MTLAVRSVFPSRDEHFAFLTRSIRVARDDKGDRVPADGDRRGNCFPDRLHFAKINSLDRAVNISPLIGIR